MFFYSYTLIDDKSNRGAISDFLVDISRQPTSIEFDTVGLRYDSQYEEESFRDNYPSRKDYVLPVGFPTLPRFWTATLANRPVAWFGTNKDEPKPGETFDSLVIMCKGLPGIRMFEAHPYFNIYRFFPSIEDTSENAMTTTQMDSIRDAVNYHGWTIGPTAPPVNFTSATWLDTLISYKHQALNLGWIDNKGIVNSLDQKLDNAKSQLQKGNTTTVKNTLRALVNEVEAQNGKHLSSEAYALLKYNVEYLISKLQ